MGDDMPLRRVQRPEEAACCQTYTLLENGRRLHQAWAHAKTSARLMRDKARGLTPEDVEGCMGIFADVQGMMLQAAAFLEQRFKYLNNVPWCFALMDSKEGAAHCVKRVRAHDLPHHDSLTRKIWSALETDIVSVAEGGVPSAALLQERDLLVLGCSLDESAGEGYHRATNMEKQRAPGSTTLHLKRITRRSQSVATIRTFLKNMGNGANKSSGSSGGNGRDYYRSGPSTSGGPSAQKDDV